MCILLVLLTSATVNVARPQLTIADPENLPFNDISNSFAKEAILRLYKQGIVSGTSEHYYEPNKELTRAEFSALIVRVLQLQQVQNDLSPFKDLKKTAWYYGDISALVNLDLVKGRSNDQFEPKSAVKREEAAVMIARILKIDVSDQDSSSKLSYSDQKKISSWARSSVAKVTELGFMQGNGLYFYPQHTLTRGEAAVLLDRVLETSNVKSALQMEPENKVQMGWQYASTTAEYEEQVLSSGINTMSPRWFFLDENNLVKNNIDNRLIRFAEVHSIPIWAMVGNRFDADLTHRLLSNSTKREQLVQKLVSEATTYGLAGLNIDFENVQPSDREYLSAFFASLYPKLKSKGILLSIDVSPDLGTDWTEAFDYKTLGKNADYIVLMAYDEHWNGSVTPGSVSSLPWLQSGVQKLMKAVDKDKIVVALPTYTRDWSLTSPTKDTYDISLHRQGQIYRSNGHTLKWDASISQYTMTYTSAGSRRKIWTEDSRSLSAKVRYLEQLDIGGYAYWYMGSETSDVWTAIENVRTYEAYQFQFN